jgi:fructose-1,6-bisphosphatase/inositol monophosphatase family enzyme
MTKIQIDIAEVEKIIRHVSATEVMPRFKNLSAGDIREKHPGDFVTVADEASEKALSAALMALLPGSIVVGEEAVAKDPGVLARFGEGKPVWVVDPIDGTYNYAHGRSQFGILVALVVDNETQYGFVYDAPRDRMAVAVRGQGATIDGKPAKIRATTGELKDMSGMGGGAQPWHFDALKGTVKEVFNVRSSLHDFLNLAAGEVDFVLHLSKVTPWDHSPTILLAQEAGAYVRIAGEDIDFTPDMLKPCILIAAPDRESWKKLEKAVLPKFKKSA